MLGRHFSTVADTNLYPIWIFDTEYVLMSDNQGSSGTVYRKGARLGSEPREDLAYGYYEDGQVWRHGRELGPGRVTYSPLPDDTLDGYAELKASKTALFRSLGVNN